MYGTRLKQLRGVDQLMFERRRGDPYVNGSPVTLDGGPPEQVDVGECAVDYT